MNGQAVIQLLGALGVAGVISAIINAFFGRKKMGADVSAKLNEAAGGIVERVESDNARLREENSKLDAKVDQGIEASRAAEDRAFRAERRGDRLSEVLREYIAYSARQTAVIRSLGGTIEDPPEVPPELLA